MIGFEIRLFFGFCAFLFEFFSEVGEWGRRRWKIILQVESGEEIIDVEGLDFFGADGKTLEMNRWRWAARTRLRADGVDGGDEEDTD